MSQPGSRFIQTVLFWLQPATLGLYQSRVTDWCWMSELGGNMKGQKNGVVARVRVEYLEQYGLNGPTFSTEKQDSRVVNQ